MYIHEFKHNFIYIYVYEVIWEQFTTIIFKS